ncbi:MAG: protein-glutamate O-methyltransferase CheR [Phormidesmis sp. RL_2_1]|nr:protein-glutamate O-methyltransferase CheR [Phormidesmis sp. RL_2_1]
MLRQRIGLNSESIGAQAILRAVKKGMRQGKMQELTDYLASLRTSPALFDALVESVVIPETSFFRNRAAFVFLRQWVANKVASEVASEVAGEVASKPAHRPLRVLSLACSTGEEPFSIAITLLEEGLTLDDFHIDAVDISASALKKAQEGIYSPYAFRRQTYRSGDKYFDLRVPEGANTHRKGSRITQRYFLIDSVRQKVSFHQGNVLDPMLLEDHLPYDVVFCRNLLIYFDQAARDRTITLLDRLLKPGGLLFVGYAETELINIANYQLVPYPQTFAYQKQLVPLVGLEKAKTSCLQEV